LVTINEMVNGQPYLLQIAQDRSADERFRKQFGVLLALALGLGFIASALVAITVTKRGLRPLAEMRHALERVQPAHLSERIESAEQEIERSLFNGRAALEKIASFYQTATEDRHLNIECSGEGQIFADPALFNRAVGNLIDNALRFTPDGGSIRMSIRNAENAT